MEFRRILLDGNVVEVVREGETLIAADGRRVEAETAIHLPPVSPTKILCCHLNHVSRVREFQISLPPARLEHRLSDGAAVIYTSMAAVLHAARFGVLDEVDPGSHEGGTGTDTIDAKIGVPNNLSEALDALEADARLVEALGPTIVAQHVAVKRTEWERFCTATTDWEIKEYLDFL